METDYIEYKKSDKFISLRAEDKKEWGKEIVGFANRNGGQIIIGKNDDGSYEGHNIFDKFSSSSKSGVDNLKQRIENYCKDIIDPPIICNITYKIEKEGEILIIEVPRKKEYPHAILDNLKRTYYIKTSHGVIPIKDSSLISWLYNDTGDINTDPFFTEIYLSRGSLPFIIDIKSLGIFELKGLWEYVPFTQQLNNVKFNDEEIENFYFDLFPYAILSSLGIYFFSSWRVLRNYHNMGYYIKSIEVRELDKINIIHILKDNIINEKVRFRQELIDVVNEINNNSKYELCVPKNTTIKIEHINHNKSKILFNNPEFKISIECFRSDWGAGLISTPYYASIINTHNGTKHLEELNQKYHTIRFRIVLDVEYEYPEDGQIKYRQFREYVDTIKEIIAKYWDINELYKNFSLINKIHSIDYKLKLIINRLGIE